MDIYFPWILLASGVYMSLLLQFPRLREAFRTRHPLGDRLASSERAAFVMLVSGALWTLQTLLQG